MPTTVNKTVRIELLEKLLGAKQTQEVLSQLDMQRESSYRQLTSQTVAAAARYLQWLTTRGQRPSGYSPMQRRQDRISFQRVLERMMVETPGARRFMETYLEKVTKEPTRDGDITVTCSEPGCGKRFLLHGLDIHMSRTHGKRGPHYKA